MLSSWSQPNLPCPLDTSQRRKATVIFYLTNDPRVIYRMHQEIKNHPSNGCRQGRWLRVSAHCQCDFEASFEQAFRAMSAKLIKILRRLNYQYYLWQDTYRFHLHPDIPPLAPDARIADVATGSG